MGDEKKPEVDNDMEWPTFDNGDFKVSYSPDNENEAIFADFKPATEKHMIRNKKRKPRSKKARALRLVSESSIRRKKRSCLQDRKRCVVIFVLVACVVIIVAISISVGVYFGVIVKGKASTAADQSRTDSSVDVVTLSPTPTPSMQSNLPPSPPTTPHHTVAPSTEEPSKTSSTSSSTSSTSTTTTTTTTSTTTTPTTTTTTTTPAPTEPPVRQFTGSPDEIKEVVVAAKTCTEEIIITTDRLKPEQKCRLYYEMLRCVYVVCVKNNMYVHVDTLGSVVETNKTDIFPFWIEIDPLSCRENGILDIRNLTTLPVSPAELCSSPDATMYYGKRACQLVLNPGALAQLSLNSRCSVRWGMLGCISGAMGCLYDKVEGVVNMYEQDVADQLHTGNSSMCAELRNSTSTCRMALHRKIEPIFTKCSPLIQSGSSLAENMTCTLFQTYFECSYNQIPLSLRNEECNKVKDGLRRVTLDLALTATKVNMVQKPLMNVSSCVDTPELSTYLCESSRNLLSVVDTKCYQKFSFSSFGTVCKYLSEYIYKCGPEYLVELGEPCTASQIRAAMISQSHLILETYKWNIEELSKQDKCIEPL